MGGDDVVRLGEMALAPNPIAVQVWKSRVQAAQAVLNAPAPRQTKAYKVLADAAFLPASCCTEVMPLDFFTITACGVTK